MPNIFDVLGNKLFPKPPQIPVDSVKKAAWSDQEFKNLKGFGITSDVLNKFLSENLILNSDRSSVYRQVESALTHPLISSALDLFAETACNRSLITGKVAWAESENKEYKYQIEKLFDVINIEEVIYDWCWTVGTYGDLFIQINGEPGLGIVSVEDDMHPISISRADYQGKLIGFFESPNGVTATERKLLAPYQFVHFRLLGAKKRRPQYMDSNYTEFRSISLMSPDIRRVSSKYGVSLCNNSLPIYRRLRLAEDSVLMARVTKGITKYLYSVGVGENSSPEAISSLIDNYIDVLRNARNLNIDTDSPSFANKNNPMNSCEDIILPVWGDVNQLRIDKIEGDPNIKWICLRGNTKIRLLDGTTPSIKEIVDNQNNYIGKYVYSCSQIGEIVPRRIKNALCTRKNAKFVRVHLDNDKYFDVTEDHRCMLRDGTFKEAQYLVEGESLMPLYTKTDTKYEKFYNPKSSGWRFTHKMVANDVLSSEYEIKYKQLIETGKERFLIIHHKDFNKFNNNPDNLEWMGELEHNFYHQSILNTRWNKLNKEERTRWWNDKVRPIKKQSIHKSDCNCLLCQAKRGNYKTFDVINNYICEYCGLEIKNEKLSTYMNHVQWNCPKHKRTVRKEVGVETRIKLSIKSKNSKWIKNIEKKEEKFIDIRLIQSYLDNGWEFGRLRVSLGTKAKLSLSRLGKKWIHNDITNIEICVNKNVLNEYISNGWNLGRLKNIPVYMNHKVKKIEILTDIEDAYDLHIEGEEHTFALDAGVFVHNCDIDELRNQLACALKVPLHLLGGYQDEAQGPLGGTAAERIDIRFARQCRRLQTCIKAGLTRLAQIHLAYQGLNPDLNMFEVKMSEVSTAEELESQKGLGEAADTVDRVTELIFKHTGNRIDKVELLNYFNKKLLKLEDLDLKKMMKSAEQLGPHTSVMPEEISTEEPTKENPFRESIEDSFINKNIWENSDLKAELPLDLIEGQGSIRRGNKLWESKYSGINVKIEEVKESNK